MTRRAGATIQRLLEAGRANSVPGRVLKASINVDSRLVQKIVGMRKHLSEPAAAFEELEFLSPNTMTDIAVNGSDRDGLEGAKISTRRPCPEAKRANSRRDLARR